MGQIIGAVQESVQVIIDMGLSRIPPILDILAIRALDVIKPCTGIVGADRLPRKPAQKLRNRLSRGLAENIPQGNIDSRISPHFHPGRAEAQIPHQIPRQRINLQGIAPQKARRNPFMDIGLYCGRAEKRLAQPGDALIRVQFNP